MGSYYVIYGIIPISWAQAYFLSVQIEMRKQKNLLFSKRWLYEGAFQYRPILKNLRVIDLYPYSTIVVIVFADFAFFLTSITITIPLVFYIVMKNCLCNI